MAKREIVNHLGNSDTYDLARGLALEGHSSSPLSALAEQSGGRDHETSDQVITEPRGSTRVRSAPEWYDNPILEVVLLHDEPTNYEEAMMSVGGK